MPEYIKGDIYTVALDGHYDMAVVFGQRSNLMAHTWHDAQRRVGKWRRLKNPFGAHSNKPVEIESNTRFWWFVPAEQNFGMSTEQLLKTFKKIFEWAKKNNIKTIITNGISDTDHGHDIYGYDINANRASDNRRVQLISDTMQAYEREGFAVTLISMNDAYVRGHAMANGDNLFPAAGPEELERRREQRENEEEVWIEEFQARENVKHNPDGSYDVNGDLDVSNIFYRRININKISGNYICGEDSFPSPQYGPKEVIGDFTYSLTYTGFPTLNEFERNRIQGDIRARINGIREFCLIRGNIYLSVGGLGFGPTPQPIIIQL